MTLNSPSTPASSVQTQGASGSVQQTSGPVGTGNYEAQPGDCIESIAYEHGLFWKTVWNHPENSQLRAVRKDPNVLLTGDRVFVPDLQMKKISGATDCRHKFVRKGVPSRLQLVLKREGKPRANLPYALEIDGKISSGVTDAQGRIQHPIPPNAQRGRLLLGPDRKEEYPLKLGNIDPITEVTGLQGRLRNLGFFSGAVDGEMNDLTVSSIREFQAKHGLNVTGEADDPTRNKLKSEHGS